MENEEEKKNVADDSVNMDRVDFGQQFDASSAEGQAASAGELSSSEKYEDFVEDSEKGTGLSEDFENKEKTSRFGSSDDLFVARKSSKKAMIFAAFVVILLLVISVGAYYIANRDEEKEGTGSSVNKEALVKDSLEKMKGAESYSFDGKISFGLDLKEDSLYAAEKSGVSSNYTFANNGVVDVSDPNNPSYYLLVDTDLQISNEELDLKDAFANFDLELSSIGDVIYLKLNALQIGDGTGETSEEMEAFDSLVEIMRGSWYFITVEDLIAFYNGVEGTDLTESSFKSSQESLDKIEEIFNSYSLVDFSEDLGEEKVKGIDTYHYEVKVDTKEAFEMVVGLVEEGIRQNGSEADVQDFLDDLKEKTEDVNRFKEIVDFVMNEVNMEIWIGKDDRYVHRFRMNGSFDEEFVKDLVKKYTEVYDNKNIASSEEDIDMDLNIVFDVDYTFSDFGSAKITAPEESKDFKKAVEGLLGAVINDQAAEEDSTDTDGDGLVDAAELYFGSDINNVDTDGDGYKDGEEVENGYDPTLPGSARLDYSDLLDSI
ncbi:MAG: hypothetical protein PHI66_01270 [Candidatus Pacebacteria bacterium]|nr:hypothetical protein [Candidatus Paceibacterota bacterium]